MFDLLEEFAVIISATQLTCQKCGFVTEEQEESGIKDTLRCPECGAKDWKETNLM